MSEIIETFIITTNSCFNVSTGPYFDENEHSQDKTWNYNDSWSVRYEMEDWCDFVYGVSSDVYLGIACLFFQSVNGDNGDL